MEIYFKFIILFTLIFGVGSLLGILQAYIINKEEK